LIGGVRRAEVDVEEVLLLTGALVPPVAGDPTIELAATGSMKG